MDNSFNALIVKPKKEVAEEIEIATIPGDKSISHRCAIFSLLSSKSSKIEGFLEAEDTLNSLEIASKLGAQIKRDGKFIYITPKDGVIEPDDVLDCGNAGTAIRLYMGFLSSCEGLFILSGDKYLKKRPMRRVATPLNEIGAKIDGRQNGELAPIVIRGSKLNPFRYESKIASAQVKSALILAALKAKGECFYKESELSRDHTERMLKGMGVDISLQEDGFISIKPIDKPLEPLEIRVPGDPSSAFFFAVAAAIMPKIKVVLKDILLNKTRVEAFNALKQMGAKIEIVKTDSKYEDIGDIYVESSKLSAITIDSNISWLIDELPALSIAMSFAEGVSVIKNAHELRVKESDRIRSVVDNLNRCGIQTEEFEDGYSVRGGEIKRAKIDSFGDHRVAMSFAVAGLICGMEIEDIECINTSFPNFTNILKAFGDIELK